MKKFLLIAAIFLSSTAAMAHDVHVNGYTRSDGTYVQPYERTAPNNTVNDNYSTQGNVNPYTGTAGTKPRDDGYSAGSSYSSYSNSLNSASGSLNQPTQTPGGYGQPLGR